MRILVEKDEREVLGPLPATNGDTEESGIDQFENDSRDGVQHLWKQLEQAANDSLGMPMIFTLASHLRESLTEYMAQQAQQAEKAANEKREAEIRAEEEKFRGTAVTIERFKIWRVEFMKKQAELKAKKEEAYVASLTPKEREEYRKMKSKPTGREIFAKNDARVEEDKADDNVKDVDFSLYSREEREKRAREDEACSEATEGYVDVTDE